ncbi:MAP kinase kinase skh1/pek1 [Trametes pubescens]|uniref:mitogen-activated protein kinase kinase n=1 Tax=Trametes pubescens TaxID=154538 RepID=A0A1M2VS69_TRAPU|nr:MAP kinase kinase skh1/pek1 [Trametes pubescens]
MQSLHPSPARPAGPRPSHRPISPAPFAGQAVAPLNIRKASRDAPNPSSLLSPPNSSSLLSPPTPNPPLSRSPTPTLSIPSMPMLGSSPKRKPMLPKIDFKSISSNSGSFEIYAGGPQPQAASPAPRAGGDASNESTIRPDQTISPRPRPPPAVSMENLRQTVEEFDQWSDDLLEELSRLGEGAGGAVYKVRDRRTGMVMARKTITTLEAPMKQLLREIKITSSTEHVNIIHFYGAYISPSSSEVKVLIDYCEGGSLESVGKRMREIGGRVGEKVAGRLAEGILQGLAYLHSRKTIHRDIKPPNILLTREGVVKLCDFGVSGELINSVAGTFTGTSLYMAPERLSGVEYTIRSDVWSTGISLLELVTNRFPFPNDLAAIELMMYITQNEPPELEDEEDIAYSAEMKDFIKKSLTRDPTLRPAPKEMLEHPWIVSMMQQKVDMAYWMRKVWGWKNQKSHSSSRPSSSRSEHPSSLDSSMAGLTINSDA